MRNDIDARKDDILTWVGENKSKAEIARRLRCKVHTLEPRLTAWGIKYSGNRGLKGQKTSTNRLTFSEYVARGGTRGGLIKQKLFDEGLKEMKCESCGITEWMEMPAPLELHHIDGNHYDNHFANLRILCSNCHSTEDNFGGKVRGTYKETRAVRRCSGCGRSISKKSKTGYCRECYRGAVKPNKPQFKAKST
jgi:Zn finger protein HypA/HybF involved in hydrogenase expression